MVFQDYELIPTKRVNKQRSHRNVYFYRLFNASGAWNSVFFGAFASYAYINYMQIFNNLRYNAVAKVLITAPVFAAGYAFGTATTGNMSETKHLIRHFATYRTEFKQAKIDALYS